MAWYRIAVCLGLGLLLTGLAGPLQPALAQFDDIQEQTAAPDADAAAAAGAATPLSADDLRAIVAPIALYPDELLAVVLPAATQPLQIVEAQRFLEKQKADPNLKPDETWDPSVLALLNYPDVIKIMSDDLDWTQRLGNAIMDQQADVIAAIQTARSGATSAGYLQSNDKQTVVTENETIVIKSADPTVVYVPSYDPTPIVENTYVNYPPPVYSQPYAPYYAPAATFFTGMFVGAAFSYGMNWHDDNIDIDCCEGGGNTNNNNVNIGNGNTNVSREDLQNRFNSDNRPQPKGGANAKGKGNGNMKWSPQKARAKSSAPRPTQRPTSSGIGKQLKGGNAGGAAGGAKVNKGPSTRPAAQTRQDSQRGNKSLGNNPQKRQQQMQQKTQQRQNARPQQQRQAPSQFKQKGGAFQQMPSQQKTRQQSNRGNRSMNGGGGGGNRGGGGGGGGRGGGSVPRRR